MKIMDLQINPKQLQQFINGYPLLDKESVIGWKQVKEEGTILNLYDQTRFIAKAYYGRQNKGYGWVVAYEENVILDVAFFETLFRKSCHDRKAFEEDVTTTAYRLFNGEGDGFGGLTLDYLDGHYLMTWYSVGVYRYKEVILEALKKVVGFKSIYQKRRFEDEGYDEVEDFVCGTKPTFPIEVLENGVKFPVYLDDGPMIGFFLDQKDVRAIIREKYAKGRDVLNTFSYTGAFSVYGALGGAKSTTSVDLANRSRGKTEELFAINQIQLDHHTILVEDVFNYFKYAKRKGLSYDLVILDPPSFARSKKHTFSAAKDYTSLMVEAIEITNRGGIIVASTNHSGFDLKKFKKMIHKAFDLTGSRYTIVEQFGCPKDFKISPKYPEGDYLKVLFVEKQS